MISAALHPHDTAMTQQNFSQLMREQHATLSAYARVITRDAARAEELVQDTFLTAWHNIEKFDITRDIAAWLRGIARNKWRESCRRNGREVAMDEAALLALEEAVHQWQADQPDIFDRLADCRSQLPEALSEPLRVCYDEARSGREAADILQINEATLRKRLERAREALRQCLQSHTQTEPSTLS